MLSVLGLLPEKAKRHKAHKKNFKHFIFCVKKITINIYSNRFLFFFFTVYCIFLMPSF